MGLIIVLLSQPLASSLLDPAVLLLLVSFLNVLNLMKTYMVIVCLTLRRLMSYIYGAPILDVSRSHTTTQHSR